MIFSSVVFVFFFLPIVVGLYFFPSRKWRNYFFIAASFAFYAWSEGAYLLVLLLLILCNYLVGRWLNAARTDILPSDSTFPHPKTIRRSIFSSPKTALVSGIVLNLIILAIFKYTNFLAANLSALMGALNLRPPAPVSIYAPLGISFLCFHALSYLIDCYRRNAPVQTRVAPLALYFAAFPKISAGPIVPYHVAVGQLEARTITGTSFLYGIERFIIGLAKKLLIANPLAIVADSAFGLPSADISFFSAWTGILCFTLQIYFDFSGYSDMAIGLGKMFGFDLPENFNFPYIAQSVREFWQRWHISLSLWFRNYLYIPLGGNRRTPSRTCLNLVLVFLLCGLWHGASWNFMLWGAWYGFFLVLERTAFAKLLHSTWRPFRHLYLLLVVTFGWVLFRADSLTHALAYMKAMLGFTSGVETAAQFAVHLSPEILFLIPLAVVLSVPVSSALSAFTPEPLRIHPSRGISALVLYTFYTAALDALFLVSCMALAGGTHKAFIYFKF